MLPNENYTMDDVVFLEDSGLVKIGNKILCDSYGGGMVVRYLLESQAMSDARIYIENTDSSMYLDDFDNWKHKYV